MLPPRERIRAVLLDLDGTLLDTAPDIAAAANRMLSALGRDQVSEARVRELIGKGVASLVRRLLQTPDGELAPELYERALAEFDGFYLANVATLTRPYPGVVAGLEALAAAGIALGCVTNKPARFTEPLLVATGLRRHFAVVVSGDTTRTKKPDPEPVRYAAAAMGVTTAQTWLIGDSLNDVQSARAAGCPVAVVPYGYREGLALEALGADAVVPSLEAAASWITMGTQTHPNFPHGPS